ncbi:hypothetical protein [Acinetobacter sp. YT-02]|uniref:hypothetical protein n=1 Tax=Acinetobacter sp. YT-02 TaxID=2018564 RepID=UPI000BD4591A|nr:hypothetical protein [Acinetobacter sp. YT-02]PCN59712.1 hypothetical protein CF596_11750 [Acinetobacter sp. YT-02]
MGKINPLAFSVIGGLSIFTITYILFWVFYFHIGTPEAMSVALNTLGSYFSGVATLWAAIAGTFLFNYWRAQHNKTIEKEMALAAIHKFDAADLHLGQFRDAFYNFNYKCQFLSEMSDKEFLNLDNELNNILASIGGVALDFASLLESVRKYCLIAEKPYYDDIESDVQQINMLIFNTKNHRAHFPDSMGAIKDVTYKLRNHVDDIETKCIDKILSELKALK